ncbi:FMN-dependent oxidoreductase, nitrilotriacetate monooxygenase family [Paenibacillus algorifonticola]|uniref:FMN-dependent oxidoreductase, nitrilotriacetate monooxygenase family n=1 Tax=Paenibacillus algorifonticola TaxID=684063 RepID=A0A1I2BEH9_9BACL|nr:LLM class flavin-dependent oxidoreductase [Paenibacillus algorifonticola]SFE54516.1 FMN-dependent oxidoreductase, nitrilotriacetate monooxygenase family [Paenibacillus algorifonticola]
MSDTPKQLKLGLFIQSTGHHAAAWRHPETATLQSHNVHYYQQLAKTAERGKFDLLFLADDLAVPLPYKSALTDRYGKLEPLTLLSNLAAVTEHIGLAATFSTTFNEPYHAARKFASLDHISDGRAAWNVVTSALNDEAHNFGQDEILDHELRYERADEFFQVASGLWDSWDEDAVQADKESGEYFDLDKVHVLNHQGTFFSVQGPLNVARPVQGRPVIIQAGSSGTGQQFAAKNADVVFTVQNHLDSAKKFYQQVKELAETHGRSRDDIKILPGLFPIIGDTQEEAEANYQQLQQLVDRKIGTALLGGVLDNIDLSGYADDEPFPELQEAGGTRSRFQLVMETARREGLTVREVYLRFASARGHLTVIGTPEQIADQMELWLREGAADGFNIMPPYMPGGLDIFVEKVIPVLQQRGLFRTEYEGGTLRENLGLRRPASRYARQESGVDV